MYLLLAPNVTQKTTVNYQSVGREVTTISSVGSLKMVPANSEVIVFYDESLDLQSLLDLHYLTALKYIFIVNRPEDLVIFEGVFNVYLIDYKIIDGALMRAIQTDDKMAMSTHLSRDQHDKRSFAYRRKYMDEVRGLIDNASSTTQVKELGENYINLYAQYQETVKRVRMLEAADQTKTREVFALRQALRKYASNMKSFILYFANLQNKYRSITALSVLKDNDIVHIPQHLLSLHIKDYGMPYIFNFVNALYDSLTVFYKKYCKVIYVCEPDGLSINRLPENYVVVSNTTPQTDVIGASFIALCGNVNQPVEWLFGTSAINTVIVVDGRRVEEQLFLDATMQIYTAPDYESVQRWNLPADTTITPSARSQYRVEEEMLSQSSNYGARNAALVNTVVNTLLERRGEI